MRRSGCLTGPLLAEETLSRRLRTIGDLPAPTAACDLSWYGPAGYPPDRPGSEACVQALCGLMELNGRDRGEARRLGLDVASVAAGVVAAQGVVAAEVGRRRGIEVPVVRTSVLQAGLLLLSHYSVVATGLGDALPGPPLPAPGPPFCSADGVWFEIETLDAEPWKDFWTRLGAEHADLGRGWTVFRLRYERAACSLPLGLHEATARLPLKQLQRVAEEAGVSLTPLRGYHEVLADPGVGVANADIRSSTGAPNGNGAGRSDGAARRASPPRGLPLAGIRVVEATSRIQGPFAGMLLRMLGADVVRVQPPEGDYGRAALSLHREKETVTLDLRNPGGRDDLRELAAGADVFLHNWRPGKATAWELDFEHLAAGHHGLVYVSASGWGDHPAARRLVGTDFLVQAYTGLGHGLNPEEEPPFPSRAVLSDLFGGLVGAEAALNGLYRREHRGCSWHLGSSLLAGAMTLQAHVLEDMARGTESARHFGRPRWGLLDRPMGTADGSLVVSVDDDESFERLCRACEVDTVGPRAAVERRVAARLGAASAARWEELLLEAGVPCAVVCEDLAALPRDPRLSQLFEPVPGTGGVAPRSPWSFN